MNRFVGQQLLSILVFITIALSSAKASYGQEEAPIAGIPKGWLIAMRQRAAEYVNFAESSFTLDEGRISLLKSELDDRIYGQWEAESELAFDEELKAQGADENESVNFAARLAEYYQRMPMNEERVVEWIVDRIADPNDVTEGQQRFLELCKRRDRINELKIKDTEDRVGLSRDLRADFTRRILRSHDSSSSKSIRFVKAETGNKNENEEAMFVMESPEADASPRSALNLVPLSIVDQWRADLGSETKGLLKDNKCKEVFEIWENINFRAWRIVATNPDLYNRFLEMNSNREVSEALVAEGLKNECDALIYEFNCRMVRYRDN